MLSERDDSRCYAMSHPNGLTRVASQSTVAVVLFFAAMVASGCGPGGGGSGEFKNAAPTVDDLIGRVLRGEKPQVVINEADDVGDAFAAIVRERAAAARRAYNDFANGDSREPACLTLDAVNAVGGVDQTPEQQVLEFAEQQFSNQAKAQAFAKDLKKLTNLELSAVPSLWCAAYSVRNPT